VLNIVSGMHKKPSITPVVISQYVLSDDYSFVLRSVVRTW